MFINMPVHLTPSSDYIANYDFYVAVGFISEFFFYKGNSSDVTFFFIYSTVIATPSYLKIVCSRLNSKKGYL